MYILFEGIDTCGKSTQIDILKETLKENVFFTKEPGGTDIGVHLRELLLESKFSFSQYTEMFLFLADRAEHFEQKIKPNLDKTIISDRGFVSGIAYALASGLDVDLTNLMRLNMIALQHKLPDKIIFFQTNEELLKKRLFAKKQDGIELRGIEYLLLVQSYMQEVFLLLETPVLQIDAALDIQTIHKQIKGFLL